MTETTTDAAIAFRTPVVADGAGMWRVVKESGVLDVNSAYQYLLWCREFGNTSIVAETDGEVHGFVTGFIPPTRPDTVFVWQIGVGEALRGKGVAGRILRELVMLPACKDVCFLDTTVSPDNRASLALFNSFARKAGAPIEQQEAPCFGHDHFPGGGHEQEDLYRIGPFTPHPFRDGIA